MKKILGMAAIIICIALCKHATAQNWQLIGNNLAGGEQLGSLNNFDVNFISNNKTRMTIKKNGKIGIGTKSPSAYLHVFGTTQIENNSGTIYDEPLLTLRNSSANGTVTNPVIAFKGDDTLFAIMGYDFSTRDMVFSTQSAGYSPDIIVNHDNGFTGLNNKTPTAQLDINSKIGKDALRVQVDSSTKLYVNDRGGVSIGTSTGGPSNGLYVFGNTGLGTSAPLYKLDVNGTSRFSGNIGIQTVPGSNTLQIGSTTGSVVGIGTAEKISDGGSSQLASFGTFRPWTDNTYSLGTSGFRWTTLWSVFGPVQTSDARDKTNVRDLNYGLKEIMQLRPIKYNWKADLKEGDNLGVIAQEIQKVLPEVVRDWEYSVDEQTGKKIKVPAERLGVMYSDIIPVLIHGMQEQQKEIEDLKQMVRHLTSEQNASVANINKPEFVSGLSLEQNSPNPVKNFTVIRYNIGNNKNAQINITDANGKIVKQMQLNEGTLSVNVDCTKLSSGTYQYSLIVDGKTVGSKQMILIK